jgi:hypothetical protein
MWMATLHANPLNSKLLWIPTVAAAVFIAKTFMENVQKLLGPAPTNWYLVELNRKCLFRFHENAKFREGKFLEGNSVKSHVIKFFSV